jgi:hypothetical protein
MIETYRIKMMIDTTWELESNGTCEDFILEQFFESYNVEDVIDQSTIEIVRCVRGDK